jgi:hypothetical protein
MSITVGEPPAPNAGTGVAGVPRPVNALDVAPVAAGSGVPLVLTPGVLCGWTLLEVGGVNPLVAELWDGQDAGGERVAVIGAAVGGPAAMHLGADGIPITRGIFLNVISGTVRGVVWAQLQGDA